MPTVGLIPPINADSNVESAVDASLQSALDKDVAGVGCDESAYLTSRLVCAGFFPHNPTVGGNLANKKARRDHMTYFDTRLRPHLFL